MGVVYKGATPNPTYQAGALYYDAAQTDPLSGTVNDLNVAGASLVTTLLLNASAAVTLNGLTGGVDGIKRTLINQSNFTITVAANATGSSAFNRFAGAAILSPGNSLDIVYNGALARWVVEVGGSTSGVNAPGGSDTDIQYNAAGSFGGDGSFTFNSSTKLVTAQEFATTGNTITSTLAITPAALTTNTNNYAPAGLSTAGTLNISATGVVHLTGLTGSTLNRRLTLTNVGSFNIRLTDQDASSSTSNQFYIAPPNSIGYLSNYELIPGASVELVGLASGWGIASRPSVYTPDLFDNDFLFAQGYSQNGFFVINIDEGAFNQQIKFGNGDITSQSTGIGTGIASFQCGNTSNTGNQVAIFTTYNNLGNQFQFGLTNTGYAGTKFVNGPAGYITWLMSRDAVPFVLGNANTARMIVDANANAGGNVNIVLSPGANAAADTNGFTYLPLLTGNQTGVPSNVTGIYANSAPIRLQNNGGVYSLKAYINGGWRSVTLV